MPFVKRDSTGRIVAVSVEKTGSIAEWIESGTPELEEYLIELAGSGRAPDVALALEVSDLALVRVVDDLINVLVEKNVMRFTDLPEAAQKKLMERQSLRQSLTALKLLGEDDHGLI